METQNPLVSLSHPKLAERAAALRDLSKVGEPSVLPRLVALAQADPSPAVRLHAASAAADILSRHRVGPRAAAVDVDERRELLALFRGIDPGVNAGLFSMLATLGLPESFQQISVGLRDPRGGVRLGAAVGLMRLCMSAAAQADTELEDKVVGLLRDRRLKPDALAEVARVCAAVGYRSSRLVLARLALSGTHGEAVSTALDVLDATGLPLGGAWISDGRDAGEVALEPALPPVLWAVRDDSAVSEGSDGWVVQPIAAGQIRRMFIRRVGEPEAAPALQVGERTFYKAREADLLEAVDRAARADSFDGGALPAEDLAPAEDRLAAAILTEVLTDSAAGLRARGLLLARAGQLDAAGAAFEAATQAKKAPADVWFFLGEICLALGKTAEAKAAWETFLKKEKRKGAPGVERAQGRVEKAGG